MRDGTIGVAACVLLAGAALVSYAVGDGTGRLTGTVQLLHPLKTTIPMVHAGWTGRDDPLSQASIRTTKLDDYVRRRYRGPRGEEVVLYVAYHGNKERGLQTYYHNATVCFPSQGWVLESEKPASETLPDIAKEIPVCRYSFAKDGARLLVMTFFKVGEDVLDQSPRNKPFWMLLDRATPQLDDSPGTFVQVQIIAPVGPDGEHRAADVQSRFLRAFGPRILKAVEDGAE